MIDEAVINRLGDLLDNERRSVEARLNEPRQERMFNVALLLFHCVNELRAEVAALTAAARES